ncbi:Developmentally-regulated GTP-binding protein 1-like [Porphyridium purpureum]|uniref:Developmentally-regulated GTP-binding protein 1-like n=1 Tax=Porphyridium purpureum TaxID=35688 RepID=A0A5J4Z0C4_PORPP|nr:Developmentally-regulated GTP-binding protein 1-like [Porphyridium purpureum]|eukprot:POR2801..scf208_2
MAEILAKIADIEAEMARTQKNKATMGHLGLLKAKIAKLKRELITPASSGGKPGEGFEVTKTGDARVGLIGFPSVGKSTLMSILTGTESEAADYEFTTLTCIPGTIHYRGAKIQMLDLPGIIEGAKDGKGRGKQVIAVARSCNLILIVLDAAKPAHHKRLIETELEGFGIRLNKQPPKIAFERKDKGGGVFFSTAVQATHLDQETASIICKEYRIASCSIILREDATADELIDVIEGNRVYIPCLYVVNKVDAVTMEELELYDRLPHYVPICGRLEWNLDGLMEEIWDELKLVRVYTKPKGQIPDFKEPVILKGHRDSQHTVEAFCNRLHKAIMHNFKYAIVWGTSVKFNPQKCGKDHVLHDQDVVQIVKKAG